MHFGPWLKTHLPRLRVLETLGRASLPVFCAHLVVALTALTVFGKASDPRPGSVDVAIVAGGLLVLYTVAVLSEFLDKRAAALRARLKASRAPALRT
jgi:peptidoglycan/LPS O-acetylase OafA/YrhL